MERNPSYFFLYFVRIIYEFILKRYCDVILIRQLAKKNPLSYWKIETLTSPSADVFVRNDKNSLFRVDWYIKVKRNFKKFICYFLWKNWFLILKLIYFLDILALLLVTGRSYPSQSQHKVCQVIECDRKFNHQGKSIMPGSQLWGQALKIQTGHHSRFTC